MKNKGILVCGYKSGKKCSHKDNGSECLFNNPLNCPIYEKWIDKVSKQLKDDFYALETPEA